MQITGLGKTISFVAATKQKNSENLFPDNYELLMKSCITWF